MKNVRGSERKIKKRLQPRQVVRVKEHLLLKVRVLLLQKVLQPLKKKSLKRL